MRGMRRESHLAISLLLFAGSSFSQTNPPNCTTGWDWVCFCFVAIFAIFAFLSLIKPPSTQSYNSLHQNPCVVASYLEGVCFGGRKSFRSVNFLAIFFDRIPDTVFEIDPLPQGHHYTGAPSGQGNLCQCNTVVYSLVSACGACQGGDPVAYVFRLKLIRDLH
jgi:hypothetical protein